MKVWSLPPDWVSKSTHRIRVKPADAPVGWPLRREYIKGMLASIPSEGGVYIGSDYSSEQIIVIFEKEEDAVLYALKWGM